MLEKINDPAVIKTLSPSELLILAQEVRQRIIDVTSKNGGHLAPSLGATDLSIALLKVFSPQEDRIVWDVGHQSYAYKILTGRNADFHTLRQFNGIGGFNDPAESVYDAFRVGHSSTSISAALGIRTGYDLQNNKARTVAIIGDGALTGGMALEALNHGGGLQKKLLVILNDNEMSISKNVGALQQYLTNMLVSKPYNQLKRQIWDLSANLPDNLRRKFILGARKIEESLKNIVVPNIIFEDLGFKYVGPVNGHNISRMVSLFEKVLANMDGPVLIHVLTQKGKGYSLAEKDATKFHGIGPYTLNTGELKNPGDVTYSDIFGEVLVEKAKTDKKILAITAAMTDGCGLNAFAAQYPDRFFDVGIAEEHAVTFAAGLAKTGLKPFVAIYSTFMQRAVDQAIHDVALQNLPVTFCLDRAGLVGADGPTHHGAFDLSFLSFIPNLTLIAPANAQELEMALDFAAANKEGPTAIRYPRGKAIKANYPVEALSEKTFQQVEGGDEIALLGLGTGFNLAVEVSALLKDKGISPYLINARFVKPLDEKYLNFLKNKVKYVFTLEENVLSGGFGARIAQFFALTDVKVGNFGLPDSFIPQGSIAQLHNMVGFTSPQIASAILGILKC